MNVTGIISDSLFLAEVLLHRNQDNNELTIFLS